MIFWRIFGNNQPLRSVGPFKRWATTAAAPVPPAKTYPKSFKKGRRKKFPNYARKISRYNTNFSSSKGDIRKIENIFSKMDEFNQVPNPNTYSALFSSFINNNSPPKNNLKMIKYYHAKMLSDKVDMTLNTYHSLIEACLNNGDHQLVNHYYDEMIESGIKLNLNTFNTMIKVFLKIGDFEKMEFYFDKLKTLKKTDPPQTFLDYLNCNRFGEIRDTNKMEFYLKEMEKKGIKPKQQTYSALLEAFGEARDEEKMEFYFKEMESKGVNPLPSNYSSLIRVLSLKRDIKKLDFYQKEMLSKKIALIGENFINMIGAYEKIGDANMVKELKEKLAAWVLKKQKKAMREASRLKIEVARKNNEKKVQKDLNRIAKKKADLLIEKGKLEKEKKRKELREKKSQEEGAYNKKE